MARKRRLFSSVLLLLITILYCADSPSDLYRKAKSFDEDSDYRRAILYYKRVFEDFPRSDYAPDALFRAATISHIFFRDIRDSIRMFKTIVVNYPEYPKAMEAQKQIAGIFMEEVLDFQNAIGEYQKLLQMNPPQDEVPGYLLNIGRCYESVGNYEQAMVEYKNIISKFPDSKESMNAKFAVNFINYIQKRTSNAIRGFEEFISEYPESELAPDALFYLAGSYEDNDNLHKALEILKGLKGKYRNPGTLRLKIDRLENRLKVRKR
ncbi:MAG TPA: tetratricopeptide repeat protein [bacterium]